MFEIPEHEVLVVSADVPPQPGETDEQHLERENANIARATRRQQEADAAAAAACHPAGNVVQGVGNHPTGNVEAQAPRAPAAPQQHNKPRQVCLRARDLLRDFE
jgi:hypothetical protein